MTWNAAQSSGTQAAGTPASTARRMRKASLAFPRVNRETMSRYRGRGRGGGPARGAEPPPPAARGARGGDEGVPGGTADPLSDPVGESHREHMPPGGGESHKRSRNRREEVPREHQRLLPPDPVRPGPREELEERGGGFRHPFDDPECGGARAQRGRGEKRGGRGEYSGGKGGEE